MPRRAELLLLVLSIAIFGGLSGCRQAPRFNVLLVVSDAFRADALDCDGEAVRTPSLCGLAARGVLFERAYANAPWTLPSSVALLTGRSPSQFRRLGEVGAEAAAGEAFYHVGDGEELLAERLAASGYSVECLVENPVAWRANALQGFTERSYGPRRNGAISEGLDPRVGYVERDGRYAKVLWALERLAQGGEAPFFFLHWIDDPHAPYQPPAALLESLVGESRALPRELDFYLGLGHKDNARHGLRKLRDAVDELSAAELAFVRRLYQLEVESVDERVGFLLRALELAGLEETTLVVFTSDHGEAFGEHGDFLHGVSLYEELVRVPLVMAGPGIARGQRVSVPVSHQDLVPTLASLLGLEGFDRTLLGRDLSALLEGGRGLGETRPLYLASPDRLDHDALVYGRLKVIAALGDAAPELYDLQADPEEQVNLAGARPQEVERLLAALERIRADNARLAEARARGADPAELERVRQETLETMRAVGYLD